MKYNNLGLCYYIFLDWYYQFNSNLGSCVISSKVHNLPYSISYHLNLPMHHDLGISLRIPGIGPLYIVRRKKSISGNQRNQQMSYSSPKSMTSSSYSGLFPSEQTTLDILSHVQVRKPRLSHTHKPNAVDTKGVSISTTKFMSRGGSLGQ